MLHSNVQSHQNSYHQLLNTNNNNSNGQIDWLIIEPGLETTPPSRFLSIHTSTQLSRKKREISITHCIELIITSTNQLVHVGAPRIIRSAKVPLKFMVSFLFGHSKTINFFFNSDVCISAPTNSRKLIIWKHFDDYYRVVHAHALALAQNEHNYQRATRGWSIDVYSQVPWYVFKSKKTIVFSINERNCAVRGIETLEHFFHVEYSHISQRCGLIWIFLVSTFRRWVLFCAGLCWIVIYISDQFISSDRPPPHKFISSWEQAEVMVG